MQAIKKTAIAPSNIAFIKYWGKKDSVQRLPENGSISMCVSNLITTTTVAFDPKLRADDVKINGATDLHEIKRVIEHIDLIRGMAGLTKHVKVVSQNNFPIGTGLSSSASGFAALSLAGSAAAGLNLSEKDLSILARKGSGSACRSIPDGFVEWVDKDTSDESFAHSLYPPGFWDIADIVAIVSDYKKEVPTSEGQASAITSAFFQTRMRHMPRKISRMKELMKEKNFTLFGQMVEEEALELHAIMLTSKPSLIYLIPGTLKLMHCIKKWRNEGLEVYFTLNTGQDMHIICRQKDIDRLINRLQSIHDVKQIITNYPTRGAQLTPVHLF